MNAPVVSIRADCNANIGYGHVMRTLSVAQALRRNGVLRMRFLMVRDSDAKPVEDHGFEVLRLSCGQRGVEGITLHASPGDGPLLLDDYAVGQRDLEMLRRAGFRVVVFDDGRRLASYPCDVVIDSAPDAPLLPYRGLPETRFCLGSEYFPLRPEFKEHARPKAFRDPARTIVISFGGSDHDDITARLLGVLAGMDGNFDIIVILGPAYAGRAEKAAKRDRRVRVLRNVADMAAVLSAADIAVSGGGSTASELAYLGVPTMLLALSADQRPVARAMANAGAAVYLGRHDKVGNTDIRKTIAALIGDRRQRKTMSRAGRSLIDGEGSERIAQAILALPSGPVRKM